MKLVELALKNRTFTWAAFAVVFLLGLLAYPAIPRREDPDLQGRFFQIVVEAPGMEAPQVEALVSDPIERALQELDDTDIISSTSRPGVAILNVEPADRAPDLGGYTRRLRAQVEDLRDLLPPEVTQMEINDRFGDTAAMIVSVQRPGASPRELEDYARTLWDRIRELSSVANADLLGVRQSQIVVELDAFRLAQFSVTPDQVRAVLAAQNGFRETGGAREGEGRRLDYTVAGELDSLDSIRAIPLVSSQGSNLTIGDLAAVRHDVEDPARAKLRVNGEEAVAVSLTMRKGLDLTKFGPDVEAKIALARQQLPSDVVVRVVNDLPASVRSRIGEFTENLVGGAILIALVTFLFMGWRSALIITLSLPITVVGVFLSMQLMGRDIQQISVAALIISLGLVVDNSIVVIDNIERKMLSGLGRFEAALEGVRELFGPLIASNLTTLGAFGPFAFLSGGVGDFIRDLGLITCAATLVSLLFNFTIIPLIASLILRVEGGSSEGIIQRGINRLFGVFSQGIEFLARLGLRRAVVPVLLAVAGMALAVMQIPGLGQQFFPGALRSQFAVDVILPEGSTLGATEKAVAQVESLLIGKKDIVSVASYVGQGSPRFYYNVTPEFPSPSIAQLVVNTASVEATDEWTPRLQAKVNATVPGATVIVRRLTQGPPAVAPIVIRLQGGSPQQLREAAEKIRVAAAKVKGSGLFFDDYREERTASQLVVDPLRANDAGLTAGEVRAFTSLAYSGQTATVFRDGERLQPVKLTLRRDQTTLASPIEDLYLPGRAGAAVRVGDVAREEIVGTESRIVRRNGIRTLTLYGYSDGTRSPISVSDDIAKAMEGVPLPGGVKADFAGDSAERKATFGEIGAVSALGVLFNIIVVAWLFPNWRVVAAISLATPISLIGAIIGLVAMGQPFGFMAVLGIVSLGGVVTNHTIVLFEYALENQRQGIPLKEALVQAGRDRFRPILLTVLLSVMGLVPQAVNGGSLWPPLAYALIFGLLISLLITLVVIPSLYTVLTGRKADSPLPTAA